jgi:A/G-specific adenine glycosylase
MGRSRNTNSACDAPDRPVLGNSAGDAEQPQDGSGAKAPTGARCREAVAGLDSDAKWVEVVRTRLVDWYGDAGRDLPWRIDRDPYRILVSELMLVQTTVGAVIPYFERFLRRFPDARALARADLSEVLKAWEGLGYYRRARQLHAAAKVIAEEHGGTIPDDPGALRSLPGVGRYVAGAIMSFAFDQPVPIVEANSQRVLARILAVDANIALASTRERIWNAAGRLVPPRGAGRFNQALIDLGALVCKPREPSCLICPLSAVCESRRLGAQDRLPVIVPKQPPLTVTEACVVLLRRERVLIVQRGPGGLWEQFWEFPTIHVAGADPARRSLGSPLDLAEGVRRLTGLNARIGPAAKTVKYSVTNHRVLLVAHLGRALGGTIKPAPGFVDIRWVLPDELGRYAFSSAGRKLIDWVCSERPG